MSLSCKCQILDLLIAAISAVVLNEKILFHFGFLCLVQSKFMTKRCVSTCIVVIFSNVRRKGWGGNDKTNFSETPYSGNNHR